MMPLFTVLVILAGVLLWFLLSFLFFPLGKGLTKVAKSVNNTITKEDNKPDEQKEREIHD